MAFSTHRQALPDSSLNQQASQSTAIALQHVTKRFSTPAGQPYTALRDLTLDVRPGEFCAVVGPTGCGKSTTLSLISGLERPSERLVEVMGKPVQGINPRIGYVFQADAGWPDSRTATRTSSPAACASA